MLKTNSNTPVSTDTQKRGTGLRWAIGLFILLMCLIGYGAALLLFFFLLLPGSLSLHIVFIVVGYGILAVSTLMMGIVALVLPLSRKLLAFVFLCVIPLAVALPATAICIGLRNSGEVERHDIDIDFDDIEDWFD